MHFMYNDVDLIQNMFNILRLVSLLFPEGSAACPAHDACPY